MAGAIIHSDSDNDRMDTEDVRKRAAKDLNDEYEVKKDKEKSKKEKKEKKEKKRKRDAASDSDVADEIVKIQEKEKENGAAQKKARLDAKVVEPIVSSTVVPSTNGTTTSTPPLPLISSFRVTPKTVAILAAKNITSMFPIQSATFDMVYDGADVVGRAKTGTGKTLAFALPVCERLQKFDLENSVKLRVGRAPRVIVLTPTRELSKQVCETFETVAPQLTCITVYGGAPYPPMEAALRRGVDVVVGTCGRVIDLLDRKALSLANIQVVILDEADEMLNMGFADDVEKILKTVPRENTSEATKTPLQTLLFSATLPSWVQNVAKKYLQPSHRSIDLVGNVQQKVNLDVTHYAIPCHWSERNAALKDLIAVHAGVGARTIIFTETKKEANELTTASSVSSIAGVLHGDIAQSQRETTLKGFREGVFTVLIATDVAARGIDIQGVELVIQIEPPQSVETYIHRSGRTGRAGQKGIAITFYTPKQVYFLQQIERIAKIKLERISMPQSNDIYAIAAMNAKSAVEKVSPEVIPFFYKVAKQMISAAKEAQSGDGKEAKDAPIKLLSAALASLSGYSTPLQDRSILCNAIGYTTIIMISSGSRKIYSLSVVWSNIRKYLFPDDPEVDNKIKGMRLSEDRMTAVFDIPTGDVEHFHRQMKLLSQQLTNERLQFEVCKQLPQLQTLEVSRPETRRFGNRGNGGSGGNRNFSRGGGGGRFGGNRSGGYGRR